MKNIEKINSENFSKRFTTLCLRSGLAGYPKNERDLQILLKSAALTIPSGMVHTEKEIDVFLKRWALVIVEIIEIDHVSLRRSLVDYSYLTRESDGSAYQVSPTGYGPDLFAPEVDALVPGVVLQQGREEIERRKREYLARQQQGQLKGKN